MADNPLYPGYQPDDADDAMSSAYPGYYPGAPMTRKPEDRNYIKPSEYSSDTLMDGLNEIDYQIGAVGTFIGARIKDDIGSSLKVSIRAKNLGVTEMDDYDTESLPGAGGIAISLNPEDWKDPNKQLKKTADKWIKSIADPNPFSNADMDNKTKTDVWNQVLGLKAKDDLIKPESAHQPLQKHFKNTGNEFARKAREGATEATRKRTIVNKNTAGYPTTNGNVLNLSGIGIKNSKGEDLYKIAGQAAVDYKQSENNARYRDSKHDGFLKGAFSASTHELGYLNEKDDLIRKEIEKQLRENPLQQPNLSPILSNSDKNIIKDYIGANTISVGMQDLGKSYDSTTKGLKKVILNGKSISAVDGKEIKELVKNYNTAVEGLALFKSEASQETLKRLDKNLRQYESHLGKTGKVLKKIRNNDGSYSINNIGNKRAFIDQITALKSGGWPDRGIQEGGNFLENVERGFLRQMVEKDMVGAGKNVSGVHEIIQRNNLNAQKVQLLTNKFAVDRRTEKVTEIMKNIEDGGLETVMEKEIWNPLAKRFETLTPSYWIERGLAKVDNFGLVIDEESLLRDNKRANTLLGTGLGRQLRKMNEDPSSVGAPGRVLGNRFKVDVEINGKRKVAKVWGGAQFKNIEDGAKNFLTTEDNIDKKVDQLFKLKAVAGGSKVNLNHANILNLRERLEAFGNDYNRDQNQRLLDIFDMLDGHTINLEKEQELLTTWLTTNSMDPAKFLEDNALLKKFLKSIGAGTDIDDIKGFKELMDTSPEAKAFLIKLARGEESVLDDIERLKLLAGTDPKIDGLLKQLYKGHHSLNDAHYLNWIDTYGKKVFGKNFDPNNKKQMASVLKALSKEQRFKGSLDITRRFSGGLEKVWTALNRIQEQLFKSPIGKYLAGIANWKTIVSEAVARAVSEVIGKAVTALIGASTAGLGLLLERVITPIIRFITNKFLDFGQKLVKYAKQGRILEAFDEIGVELAKTIRKLMAIVAVPLLIMIAFIQLFFTVLFTTISPVDETRASAAICKGTEFKKLFPGGAMPALSDKNVIYLGAFGGIDDAVMDVYAEVEEATGVPCEILAGIHFREGANNPDQSLIDGDTLPNSKYGDLLESAMASARIFKDKLGIGEDVTEDIFDGQTIEDVMRALSYYNGGGNANCRWPDTDYEAPCPPAAPIGIDDPYVMNWYDEAHSVMNLIFCVDGDTCQEYCPSIVQCNGTEPSISTSVKLNPTIEEFCLSSSCSGGVATAPSNWPILDGPGALPFGIWFHAKYIGN